MVSDPLATADRPFQTIADLVRQHALERPRHPAIVQGEERLDYAQLDALMDRVSASLRRDGVRPGDAIAICAQSSPRYAAVFLGALRAGVAVAPLAPSVTRESFASMLGDAQARWLFVDAAAMDAMGDSTDTQRCISMDGLAPGVAFESWLAPDEGPHSVAAQRVDVSPEWPFNIIYSSGTTGNPKGIVQSHGMRWSHVSRGANYAYGEDGVTVLATPLYSNTTLVSLPANDWRWARTVVLMAKFDAKARYLELAQAASRDSRQCWCQCSIARIMALPGVRIAYDLSSSFSAKFSTSAPFNAAPLKADILKRWPGRLIEYYGMTEGGGTCVLEAQQASRQVAHGRACPRPATTSG